MEQTACIEEAGEAIRVECVEDEYLVSVDHEMVKGHYISFLAVESCNRDGLMEKKVK